MKLKDDYECPRCGFTTYHRASMRTHLYKKIKPCPGSRNTIELTDDIKQHILDNKRYIIPKPINNSRIIYSLNSANVTEYIYLIQEREFIKTNEPIYKIGKTKQENLKRICTYPNGSRLIIQTICSDCDKAETDLIRLFKSKYLLQKDIGNEYFRGDCIAMRKDINAYIDNYE